MREDEGKLNLWVYGAAIHLLRIQEQHNGHELLVFLFFFLHTAAAKATDHFVNDTLNCSSVKGSSRLNISVCNSNAYAKPVMGEAIRDMA